MSRRFFRNAAFLTLIELVVKAKGLIILPILTKYLGPESFGIWSQTAVIASTISPLIVLGTDSAVVRYLPGLPEEQQKRFFFAWAFVVLPAAMLAGALLFGMSHKVSVLFFGREGFAAFVLLAALMLLMTLALNCLRNWFRIRNETRAYGLIAAAQAIVSLLALLWGVHQDVGLARLMLYTILADALVALACLAWIWRSVGLSTPDFSVVGKFLKYGLPLVPASFAMWGLGYMDRLFLAHYGSLQEIGIYSLVYQIGYIAIQFLVNPVWTMYASTASEAYNQGRQDNVQRLFNQSVGTILFFALPSIVGLLILGRDMLSLLSSPEFMAGAPLISIVAFGYLLLMLSAYYETSLGLIHRQYLSTVAVGVAFLVNLVGNILMIPKYSILGAAIATALGFAAQLMLSMMLASRYELIRTDFRYPARVLIAALLMGAPLYLTNAWLPEGPVWFLVNVLSGMAYFLIFAWLLRLLPAQFVALIVERMRHG